MVHDWWVAHKLEFIVAGFFLAFALAAALIVWASRIRRKS